MSQTFSICGSEGGVMYLQAMVENLKSHDSGFIDKADFVKLCTVRGGWRGSVRRGMVVRRMVVRRLGMVVWGGAWL